MSDQKQCFICHAECSGAYQVLGYPLCDYCAIQVGLVLLAGTKPQEPDQ